MTGSILRSRNDMFLENIGKALRDVDERHIPDNKYLPGRVEDVVQIVANLQKEIAPILNEREALSRSRFAPLASHLISVFRDIELLVAPPTLGGQRRTSKKRISRVLEAVEELKQTVMSVHVALEPVRPQKELDMGRLAQMVKDTVYHSLKRLDWLEEIELEIGRTASQRLQADEIAPHTKPLIDTLIGIELLVRPKGQHRPVPWANLHDCTESLLKEQYYRGCSNTEGANYTILVRISHLIGSNLSPSGTFEDLPSKIESLLRSRQSEYDKMTLTDGSPAEAHIETALVRYQSSDKGRANSDLGTNALSRQVQQRITNETSNSLIGKLREDSGYYKKKWRGPSTWIKSKGILPAAEYDPVKGHAERPSSGEQALEDRNLAEFQSLDSETPEVEDSQESLRRKNEELQILLLQKNGTVQPAQQSVGEENSELKKEIQRLQFAAQASLKVQDDAVRQARLELQTKHDIDITTAGTKAANHAKMHDLSIKALEEKYEIQVASIISETSAQIKNETTAKDRVLELQAKQSEELDKERKLVFDLKQQIQDLKDSNVVQLRRIKDNADKAEQELVEGWNQRLSQEQSAHDLTRSKARDDADHHERIDEARKTQFATEINTCKRSLAQAQREYRELDTKRLTQLKDKDSEHENILRNALALASGDYQSLKDEKGSELAAQAKEHALILARTRGELRNLEAKRLSQLATARAEHEEAMGSARSQYRILDEERMSKMGAQRKNHEDQMAAQIREHKAQMAAVKTEFEKQTASWEQALAEKDKECLKSLSLQAHDINKRFEKIQLDNKQLHALFIKGREKSNGLIDAQIMGGLTAKQNLVPIIGFATIVSRVDSISNWQWREDREVWPSEVLTELTGKSQQRLKTLILADVVWTALYDLIFCSPFRILGAAGREEEKNWLKSFPPDGDEDGETKYDYRWPAPTYPSEKYRYDTCLAALKELTQKTSPYARLRASFLENKKPTYERFFGTISAYVILTEKREQDLVRFLSEASQLWLVLCTQRYRIRVLLPGSSESEPAKKMALTLQNRKDFKFTVEARIQRHGDTEGDNLKDKVVVSGSTGKAATIYD